MRKAIILSTLVVFVLTSCGNELYTSPSLRLLTLQNVGGKVLNTYRYKVKTGELYTFTSANQATGTSTISKFYFKEGKLEHIIRDSTSATNYTRINIHFTGTTAVDSVFLIEGTERKLIARHYFEFNADNKLTKIGTTDLEDSQLATEAEFVWQDEVIAVVDYYSLSGSQKVKTQSASITYDKMKPVFSMDFAYYYTWQEQDWCRFSNRNPVEIVASGQPTRTFKYTYNKFDYPYAYTDRNNVKYIATYTQATQP